jgi:hypothetical protein
MLGVLAKYLNETMKKKVIIVVPSAFLHAYQQHFYCLTASKVPEKLSDPTAK